MLMVENGGRSISESVSSAPAMTTPAPVEPPPPAAAAEARLSSRRKASGLSTTIDVAKRSRPNAAFAARFSESSRRLAISIERPCAESASCAFKSPSATAAIEVVTVIERSAARKIPVVVIEHVVVMPVESPVAPSPSEAAKPSNSKSQAERKIWPTKPDSRIGIPSWPGDDGISINRPWIVGWNINHIGLSRLNIDVRTLFGDSLLRSRLQVARVLRFPAHDLHRIHKVLLLVVISVAER